MGKAPPIAGATTQGVQASQQQQQQQQGAGPRRSTTGGEAAPSPPPPMQDQKKVRGGWVGGWVRRLGGQGAGGMQAGRSVWQE